MDPDSDIDSQVQPTDDNKNVKMNNDQEQPFSNQELLVIALEEKFDPDKNGLALVPKDITSSTLTTRLKGVRKINRLIDGFNDICNLSTDPASRAKCHQNIEELRHWILRNRIIEHIFGPNCHVEIIKQSHVILNFVACWLDKEHVNVIWSASLLKHCGRQVLDLLTCLIRYMRDKPVLHLYSLVKNLNIEDHSEHTLLLTSHILRFIWAHSPCIKEMMFTDASEIKSQSQEQSQQEQSKPHTQRQRQVSSNDSNNDQQLQTDPESVTIGETIAEGGIGSDQQPAEDVERKVVDHILKFISDNSSRSSSQQKQYVTEEASENQPLQSNSDSKESERKWLKQWKNNDFLDNTSDVSACCSEEKDMGDFDDDGQEGMVFQDENTIGNDGPNTTSSEFQMQVVNLESSKSETLNSSRSAVSNSNNTAETLESTDSTSTSRDSDTKIRISLNKNVDHCHQLPLESVAHFKEAKKESHTLSINIASSPTVDESLNELCGFNLENLSHPGKTLLWDLLQDGKIEHLAPNLHVEIENVLVNLVMSFGERYIRYRFIEACLENLSHGTSVIISLRLLPKLMSFNTIARNVSIPAINETHTIVLWAESEHNMSQNFFKNLVQYYKQRQQLLCSKLILNGHSTATAITNDQLRHLEEFGDLNCKSPMFSHIDKIITRMSFLTFIYSKPFSPESMKLNREQMDQLWDCLASDSNLRCSDVLFQWIYQQAVSDDFHAVNDELLDYVLKHKLPTLEPEHFRLRGLKLLEQLLWIRQDFECCHGLEHPATRLLWDIGLKAVDDEVSMAAIRILNHFYIYTNHRKSTKCDKGINFMNHCMDQLHSSLTNLTNQDDYNEINHQLDVMQKIIILIRTHLEVFRAHWSFYLRMLQLNNEADLVSHRLNAYDVKITMTIRLVCQAASTLEKTTIEMQAGDFVGELRAEIAKWFYNTVDRAFWSGELEPTSSPESSSQSSTSSSATTTHTQEESIEKEKPSMTSKFQSSGNTDLSIDTEFLLSNYRSLRLLSANSEIPFEWDERQINEFDFKEMQVIYVVADTSALVDRSNDLPEPVWVPKTEIPSVLLLRYEYFERLMEAGRFLGSFRSKNIDLVNRAKALSRRVWEIIQILPTCPHYKEDLKRCGMPDEDWRLKTAQCSTLLNADCPQRLLYSLQIIDILRSSCENSNWGAVFIRKGGLVDLFDVFMSQKLLPDDSEDWNEWLQDCLAYLLKLLYQFSTRSAQISANDSSSSSSSSKISLATCSSRTTITPTSSLKRIRRNRSKLLCSTEDRYLISQFSDELLNLLADTDLIFNKLIRILKSSALCRSQSEQYYYVTMSNRAMIVHHIMNFLSSWCKSDPKFPKFQISNYEHLLKALILDDPDSSTRREACTGFYKLHHACITKPANTSVDSLNSLDSSGESSTSTCENWTFSSDLLKCLIKFLPIAEEMKPPKPIRNYICEQEYIRELNSPGCKDYFWLTSRLIDSPAASSCITTPADRQKNISNESSSDLSMANIAPKSMNMFNLCEYLVAAIRKRQTYETRDFSVEDDTLRGMLHMMAMALKCDPTFRYSNQAYEFIQELYDYLFAPPNQDQRYLPKCKSPATRSTAFELMIALVERCPKNYFGLLELLLVDQHNSVVKGTYPTDYWPHDDCRSEVGFVGLVNLGATCYLATCMQHLFMIPDLRYAILSIEDISTIRHSDIIRELQKIFTFMLESERKAYNPRNFCKVYTMDNHPLNIAEQTDMTEFLTDLITKLEESSPELRHIIKELFSGTLSNNVVSLDCPHISRTTEEFYTLRVQVSEMRNLNDSLDELTVKDTLEGDNMYTCSTCEKKVRAEKRACIVKLPRILCFNTMRYTFNMATMTKEKVNTHFSFPLKLDMAHYLETNLMERQQSSPNTGSCSSKDSSAESSSSDSCKTEDSPKEADHRLSKASEGASENPPQNLPSSTAASPSSCSSEPSSASNFAPPTQKEESETMYELIGVTVHTGNADGGHYYCFIRDCEDHSSDKPRWYLFNDAEVKPFDDSHIGTECYGGELTTKSYDAINDRFMDFSIEKTNSAYMLFYKRIDYKFHSKSVASRYLESDTQRGQNLPMSSMDISGSKGMETEQIEKEVKDSAKSPTSCGGDECTSSEPTKSVVCSGFDFNLLSQKSYDDFNLPRSLASWIWNDNMKFARDKNVFEHNYFNFMWQICANIPRTLNQIPEDLINSDQSVYSTFTATDDSIAIRTVHLAIAFVLGVLMNSRERPNLANWTELIRKQFNSSKAACDWLMHLIDDEETWLKQMLLKCPIEMIRQLFQRLCNDLTGTKQHKKLRLIR